MIDWMRNFFDNYTNDMYFPSIQVMDIIEILIITVIVYEIMLWIKNTKAWMLLRGIIMLALFIFLAWIFKMHDTVSGGSDHQRTGSCGGGCLSAGTSARSGKTRREKLAQ